uniref:Uncharacterized protein n=1 Tax=Anguilla anguilla TaxID=7936 RepID=A0A0E9XRX5_ANGAN
MFIILYEAITHKQVQTNKYLVTKLHSNMNKIKYNDQNNENVLKFNHSYHSEEQEKLLLTGRRQEAILELV